MLQGRRNGGGPYIVRSSGPPPIRLTVAAAGVVQAPLTSAVILMEMTRRPPDLRRDVRTRKIETLERLDEFAEDRQGALQLPEIVA
jgi:hypothetical protein